MQLHRLRIADFRNHSATDIECPEDTLLLIGDNGAGKTTVLEAISMLCTSQSFVTRQDKGLISSGAECFFLEGDFIVSAGAKRHVTIAYPVEQRKRIEVDYAPVAAATELIGLFPIVALSPQHRPITAGGPAERRSFIDFVISQVYRTFLEDLLVYRKVLKQRNALLAEAEGQLSAVTGVLDAWDLTLADSGVRILRQRAGFLRQFMPFVQQAMNDIVDGREEVEIEYVSSGSTDITSENAAEQYYEELRGRRNADLRRATTSIGPHRDDLSITLNGLEVRTRASQGQHKTLLIALKLAEFYYLNERLDETPILLFDDVFSELDDERLSRVLTLIQGLGQTFITSANARLLQALDVQQTSARAFHIENGLLRQQVEVA